MIKMPNDGIENGETIIRSACRSEGCQKPNQIFLLFRCQPIKIVKHFLLYRGKRNRAFFFVCKKLGKCDSESVADFLQIRDCGHRFCACPGRDGGLSDSGFLCKLIFRPVTFHPKFYDSFIDIEHGIPPPLLSFFAYFTSISCCIIMPRIV